MLSSGYLENRKLERRRDAALGSGTRGNLLLRAAMAGGYQRILKPNERGSLNSRPVSEPLVQVKAQTFSCYCFVTTALFLRKESAPSLVLAFVKKLAVAFP